MKGESSSSGTNGGGTHEKVVAILGSARDHSNTERALDEQLGCEQCEVVDLHKHNIQPYQYGETPQDEFLQVADTMAHADTVVFATPVYSSSMSTQMKIFIDRLNAQAMTDRSFRGHFSGKKSKVLATGNCEDLPEGFEVPFRSTCETLGMQRPQFQYVRFPA